MNSRQDQADRGGRNALAVDTARGADRVQNGQPMSRREAREAERRAAEALAAGQAHPSGVVDFTARDLRDEYGDDQAFQVQDTTDIWAALSRRGDAPSDVPQPPSGELSRFQSGVPDAPAVPRSAPAEPSAVSGELLDRVRGAVLGRGRDGQPAPAQPSSTQPAPTALTRRELRQQQLAGERDDDLPAEWFTQGAAQQAAAPRSAPVAGPNAHAEPAFADPTGFIDPTAFAGPAVFAGQDGYVEYDDAFYDAPYEPEPTVAIQALLPTELESQSPMTAPVNLPQFFAEPTGDDALTFSSPVPITPAEPRVEYAEVDPTFVEPRSPWGDLGGRSAVPTPPASAFPQRPAAVPSASAAPGFLPAAEEDEGLDDDVRRATSAFSSPQLGPPSEVTDLAGFEALIRQARNTPPAPQRAEAPAPKPSLPWADDEDVQDGFTGLLSRSVQGSHGSPNALIMPNDPQPDLTQAVNRTGDIFITGSMSLSRSLSTTGATSNHDALDLDHMFEGAQDEATGVAPVRASSAISGAVADRSFVTGRRATSNILPTVLAIVAGAMAVGVVTLLVGSWVLKLF